MVRTSVYQFGAGTVLPITPGLASHTGVSSEAVLKSTSVDMMDEGGGEGKSRGHLFCPESCTDFVSNTFP